ncbi:alpha-isopropylmalate synthase regulatory domain-containing protein, partial [Streptomyces sp. NPDC002920]
KTDAEGGEITGSAIWAVFQDEYLPNPENPWGRIALRDGTHASVASDGGDTLTVEARVDGVDTVLTGHGNGPISAFADALSGLGIDIRVLDYSEHTMSAGAAARAASYIECALDGRVLWGVGIDVNTTWASLRAVTSAVNRLRKAPHSGVANGGTDA